MTELLVLDLVDKKLVTDQMVLTVGYDIENLEKANPYLKQMMYQDILPAGNPATYIKEKLPLTIMEGKYPNMLMAVLI